MKLETFFEKSDLFAEVPDAVAKMREMILDWALKGRLVVQDPNDEPAAELALRIRSERKRRAKEGKPGKLTDYPSIEADSSVGEIPVSWSWVPLGDITFIRTGKLDANASSSNGQYPFFTCAREPLRIDRFAYDCECVLLAGNGNFDVNYYDGKFEAYQRTYIIEGVSRDMVHGRYLYRFIQNYADTLRGMSVGGVISYIKIGFLTDAPFPLPPFREQQRIVTKVDALMAFCDRLEAQQQERETRHAALALASLERFADAPTPANLNFLFHPSYVIAPADLRKSILALAVQGKLVSQNPKDEPADDVLQAIQEEKQSLMKRGLLKRVERVDFDPSEPSDVQPAQWRLATLAATCVSVTDGDHLPPPKAESGIPFLVISNVRWGGIDFEGCRYVLGDYFNKLDWIRKPLEGDILYTLVGSFGIPVVVRDARPFCVQRHIGILRPSKHIDRYYLAYALATDLVLQQATSIATGIAQKTVPLAGLRRIKIPLPPLAEQCRIVAKVDQLMALVDQLETQLAASRATAAKLTEAMVSGLAAAA